METPRLPACQSRANSALAAEVGFLRGIPNYLCGILFMTSGCNDARLSGPDAKIKLEFPEVESRS